MGLTGLNTDLLNPFEPVKAWNPWNRGGSKLAQESAGRSRSPCMPPSTASEVPLVEPESGLAR